MGVIHMIQTAEKISVPDRGGRDDPCLRWEQANAYLADLQSRGRTSDTIQTYRRNLLMFFGALPKDGRLDRVALARWRDAMVEQGYTPRTVNVQLAAANGFLEYLGLRDYQLSIRLKPAADEVQPELTRTEYLRLLSTARTLGKERTYFMVKVFAILGLTIHDLPKLTVEAVHEGMLVTSANHSRQLIQIPNCLQRELLGYIRREGIRTGPVFITRSGAILRRTAVTGYIQQLAKDARVAPEKCNPRCLRKLYQSTRDGIRQNVAFLVDQAHERLLEQEQLTIGWEEVNRP